MGISYERYQELPGTETWVDPDNPTLSKSLVLAYHRSTTLIPAIRDDLAAREMKRRRR